jgi:hypothetical protein
MMAYALTILALPCPTTVIFADQLRDLAMSLNIALVEPVPSTVLHLIPPNAEQQLQEVAMSPKVAPGILLIVPLMFLWPAVRCAEQQLLEVATFQNLVPGLLPPVPVILGSPLVRCADRLQELATFPNLVPGLLPPVPLMLW